MAFTGPEYGAPSHLGHVLRAVDDIFKMICADATPLLVGEHYASPNARGVGSAPHVILVPEPRGGRCRIESAYEMGHPGKHVHRCDVIVRAAETGDDLTRMDPAYDLLDLVVSAVSDATKGRMEWTDPTGDYPAPTTVDAYGVQLSIGFTFSRDIRTPEAIASRGAATADETPVRPIIPPGETGDLDTITGTVDAAEDE